MMKRRLFSIMLVFCLCASLVPVGAGAEGGTNYQYVENPTEVSTYDAMKTALPSGETEPDSNNIIWIKRAKLTQNLTLTSGQCIATLGKLEIPSGVTLTIADGTSVEAEVEVQSGGAVKVEAGGTLATTMAGEHAIANAGTITVEKGGVLRSQKGGSVVNEESATLTLDGSFYCGSVNYDSADHLWFFNNGTVFGNGEIIVYDAGVGDDNFAPVNLDAMITKAKNAVKNEGI